MTGRLRHTLQVTQAECGLCCAHMVLRSYGSRESMTSLRQSFDVGRDGLTLRGVADVLRTRGMTAKAYRVPAGELHRFDGPVTVLWEDYHYVVVESVGSRSAVIVDPNSGRRKLPRDEFDRSYSGIVVSGTPGPAFDRNAHRSPSPWRAALAHLRTMRVRLAVVFAISVLTYGGTLAAPVATEYLVNDAAASGFHGTSLTVLSVVLGISLTYFLLLVMRTVTSTRLVTEVGVRMMSTTFGQLLRLPYRYFNARSTGELMYRLNSQTLVRDVISTELVNSLFQFGTLGFVVGYMLWRSLQLSAIAFGLLAVLCAILGATRRRTQEVLQQEMSASSKASGIQFEAIAAIESLKLSGSESDLFRRWQANYREAMDRVARRLITQGRVNAAVSVIQFAGPLLILAYGLLLYGRGDISLGAVIAFQTLSATFFATASSLFAAYTQFLQVGSLLDRIRDIDEAEADGWPQRGVTKQIAGGVRLRDVAYSYGTRSANVLEGIDLDIEPGAKVALVGRSGSGKSTLGRLICGLYEATQGSVEIDSIPLRDYDRTSFYRQIGAVPQDVKLQNLSIADNIAIGCPDATQDDIERAASAAQIHDDIVAMPLGYKTVVSELGANLSGGQRQRIAIARTLVGSPRLVVYDEATSSLDLRNEALVSEHLLSMNCTRIVIAHRLSTVVDADQIVVMSDGRIVERGTHDELMLHDGEYRALFDRQSELRGVAADDSL